MRAWAIDNVEEVKAWQTKHPSLVLTPASENWWMLYSQCLDSFTGPAARQEFIYQLISRATDPNRGHIHLAHLMRKDVIRTALTTNFDELLKRALAKFDVFPAELDPNSTRDELTVETPLPQVVYLHGKSTSYRQRHIGSETRQTILGLEEFFQQSFIRGGLIVVGYRGGDETPMDILMNVVSRNGRGPGRGLFWVTPEKEVTRLSPRVRKLLGFEAVYCVSGIQSDEFFESISIPIVGGPIDYPGLLPRQLQKSGPQLVADACDKWSKADYDGAIGCCRNALEWDPRHAPAHVVWGNVLYMQGKPKDAIDHYRDATTIDPTMAGAFLDWGKALAQIGSHREAIEKYEHAASLDPNNPRVYDHLSESLKELGRSKQAREARERAFSLVPRTRIGQRLR